VLTTGKPLGRDGSSEMVRGARGPIMLVSLVLVLAACAPKVSFFGDSELSESTAKVIAAQTGPDGSTTTSVSVGIGCGLLPNGASTCPAGTTQRAVDAFWKHTIATDMGGGAPAYVQVELGIDDAIWYHAAKLQDYKARIERFISWLPPGVPVLWDNIPFMAPTWDLKVDRRYQIVNQALAAAAAETSTLHVVDLRTPFAGHYPEWFQSDQLNYNDSGQYTFALVNCQALDAVSAALDPNHTGVAAPCDPDFGGAVRRSRVPER
jgi:hypothetical protein